MRVHCNVVVYIFVDLNNTSATTDLEQLVRPNQSMSTDVHTGDLHCSAEAAAIVPPVLQDITAAGDFNCPVELSTPVYASPANPAAVPVPQSISNICASLINNDMDSVADKMFQNQELKNLMLDKVCKCIDEECMAICSRNDASIFRKYDTLRMNFEWSEYASELKDKAPALYRVLCKVVCHSDKRNKRPLSHHNPGMCTAAAILLKERNREMNGLQTVISLLLFSSNTHKQVGYIGGYI